MAGEPPSYEFMVAIDVEDRKDKPLPLVRMVSRIELEWLINLFPDRVHAQPNVTWNRATEQVKSVSVLIYDDLVSRNHETRRWMLKPPPNYSRKR